VTHLRRVVQGRPEGA